MSLFRQNPTIPAEAGVKTRLRLLNSGNSYHKGSSNSYTAIIRYFSERYILDGNIERLHATKRTLCQKSKQLSEFTQELRLKHNLWVN